MKRKTSAYFLPRLYRDNRPLFWIICLVGFLHVNANFFIGAQQSPFFRWDLYARPMTDQDTFHFYEARYNKDKVLKFPHTWQQPLELFFLNPLNQYVFMYQHNSDAPLKAYINRWNTKYPFIATIFPGLKFYPDSVEMKKFPEWYSEKITQITGDRVDSISVYRMYIRYDREGKAIPLPAQFLFKLK